METLIPYMIFLDILMCLTAALASGIIIWAQISYWIEAIKYKHSSRMIIAEIAVKLFFDVVFLWSCYELWRFTTIFLYQIGVLVHVE